MLHKIAQITIQLHNCTKYNTKYLRTKYKGSCLCVCRQFTMAWIVRTTRMTWGSEQRMMRQHSKQNRCWRWVVPKVLSVLCLLCFLQTGVVQELYGIVAVKWKNTEHSICHHNCAQFLHYLHISSPLKLPCETSCVNALTTLCNIVWTHFTIVELVWPSFSVQHRIHMPQH